MLSTQARRAGPQPANIPTHQVVYQDIRDMVLFGEVAPGQPITIQGLVSALDTGITPVREAIRRLTAEGALTATDTRRVLVPELNDKLLAELSFARLAIEPQLAKRAASRVSSAQIDELEAIDFQLDAAIEAGDVRGYLTLNYQFHRTLYVHSGADILLSMADALWLRAGPSLRVVCGRFGTSNLPDMHEEAIAALRKGDPDGVASAIHRDIAQGHSQIAKAISDP